jgi:ABC-type antimicrobial peptide transport system permease subunit
VREEQRGPGPAIEPLVAEVADDADDVEREVAAEPSLLGAKPADILKLVLGRGLRLTLGGILLGLVGALAAGRFMQGLLFGVGPADAMSFGGLTLLIGLVSMAACLIPALRALRIDPGAAIRDE